MTDSSKAAPEPERSASADDGSEITDLIKHNSRYLGKAALPAVGAAALAALFVAMSRKGRRKPNEDK